MKEILVKVCILFLITLILGYTFDVLSIPFTNELAINQLNNDNAVFYENNMLQTLKNNYYSIVALFGVILFIPQIKQAISKLKQI